MTKTHLVLLLALLALLAVEGTSLRHKKHAASQLRKRKHFPVDGVGAGAAHSLPAGKVGDRADSPPGTPISPALLARQQSMRVGRVGRVGEDPASPDATKPTPVIEDTTGPVAVDDDEGKIVVPQPLGDALKPLADAAIGALKSVAGVLAQPVGTYTVATDRLALGLFGACVIVLATIFEENRLERKQGYATLARTKPRSGKNDVDYSALAEELNPSVVGVTMMMIGAAGFILSMFLVDPALPWVLGWNEKAIGQAVCWTVACLASILLLFSYEIKRAPGFGRQGRPVEADGLPSGAYPVALLFVVGWIVGSVLTGLDASLSGTVPNGYRMGLAVFGLVCILFGSAYNYIHRFRSKAYKIYNGGALMVVLGWFCAVYSQSIVDNSELAFGGGSTSAPILGWRFIMGFVGVVLLAHGFNVCETAKDKNADVREDREEEGQEREGANDLPWKGLGFFLCGWSLWILSAWLYPPTPTTLGADGSLVEQFGCSSSCTRPVAIFVIGVLLCFLRSGVFTSPKAKWTAFLPFDDTNKGAVVDFKGDSGKVANQLFVVVAWFGFATAIALSDSDELSMAYLLVCWVFASMIIMALHMLEKLRLDAHRPEHLFNFAQPLLIAGLLGLNFVNAINH